MCEIKSFRDLRVWQRGLDLAEAVYESTGSFPPSERFGLQSQMRRSAVSVPSNIAEGWGRESRAEYIRFLVIARASLFELMTQIELAQRVGLGTGMDSAKSLANEIGRMLSGLLKALRNPNP
ncbi:MAG: four helix bundle protein [Planctomycetota bacterium]